VAKHKESGESPIAGVQDAGQIAALESGRSRRGAVEESGACLPSQHFGALRQGDRSAQARRASFPPPTVSGAHVLRTQNKTKTNKRGTFLPDIDMIDCAVRQENIHARGDPIMLQLPLVPAYALTVHKTQAVVLSRAVSLYLLGMFVAARTHSHVTRTSP
jgi:hypothetical protein